MANVELWWFIAGVREWVRSMNVCSTAFFVATQTHSSSSRTRTRPRTNTKLSVSYTLLQSFTFNLLRVTHTLATWQIHPARNAEEEKVGGLGGWVVGGFGKAVRKNLEKITLHLHRSWLGKMLDYDHIFPFWKPLRYTVKKGLALRIL